MDRFADDALLLGRALEDEHRPGRAATETELSERLFLLVHRQMASLVAGSGRDLDDLVQIAAEQVLRSLPRYEGRAELSTWTYSVCYLTMLKHDRSRSRWLRRFRLAPSGELPDRADPSTSAPDALERRERITRLRAAVAELPPKRRAVVVLCDLEGLSVPEVAAIVGAKVATVRSRLRDGRRLLGRRLARDPYFGDRAHRKEQEP